MYHTPIISTIKVQKLDCESTSDPGQPKAWESSSERNDNPVSRHFALLTNGKRSLRAAVNAMCGHCMGCKAKEQGYSEEDWIEPGFRKQIRTCSAHACPLWEFRPYQSRNS